MSPDPITLQEKCGTCAFRPGTDANRSVSTRLKAQFCAMTGELFLCHEHNPDIGVPHGQDVLCKGWVELFAANMRNGRLLDGWKRDVQLALTEVIVEVEKHPELYSTDEAIHALVRERVLETKP